ncbi:translation initiation factor IF-3 [Dichotomicrobium thermohalophilum]|uniref:Translation initiation factor IF-3 n=1 Tax=Dichotomicrobium thermohalophilum TaxID=933063 RepID=A0A397PI80_9HYPH|nr:translation initiation factor IF-3 [Dichotomicrobium thermohalophilum]RIA47589.1 translation initiation factor 3 (bIF-3) [Dichotomicrobium thermohalophilum]
MKPVFSRERREDAFVLVSATEEIPTIARRPFKRPAQREEGPRINDAITARQVQLIDEEGQNHGVVDLQEALDRAAEAGLDLVEVSGQAETPVCKIMDYGKYKYQAQKKAAEARKKTKTVDVKEIKMRPNIDAHDYEVKMRNMRRFFEAGDKVKVTLRFRGREMAHQQIGMDLLHKVRDDTEDFAKVELEPKLEGRQMIMVLAPR